MCSSMPILLSKISTEKHMRVDNGVSATFLCAKYAISAHHCGADAGCHSGCENKMIPVIICGIFLAECKES